MNAITRRTTLGAMLAGLARAEPPGRIERLAGTGSGGFTDGPARQAKLSGPAGLGVGPEGAVYIADLKNNAIRRVAAGHLTTIAGTGEAGCRGDGGPATKALLNRPEGVAADAAGNVYIADSGNNRIRRIGADGVIETIAGGGQNDVRAFEGDALAVDLKHPAGVAADAQGTVYFNDYGHDIIGAVTPDGRFRRVAGTGTPGYSGDGGAARDAAINDVYGIGIDPGGRLYLCDSLNFAIRRIEGGVITSVVTGLSGTPHPKGTIGSNVPHGVDADANGTIFVADTAAHRLIGFANGNARVLAGSGKPGTLVADGTQALVAGLDLHGVRVMSDGSLIFPDYRHDVVYRLVRS